MTRSHVPVFRGHGGLRPDLDATSNHALLQSLDEGRSTNGPEVASFDRDVARLDAVTWTRPG